jgi:hypothetical protein
VIRALWSGDRSVRAGGTHYQVKGVHPGPPAAPGLGIWLGAYRPRMLALTTPPRPPAATRPRFARSITWAA